MPYLQFLFCERCGDQRNLDLDSIATVNAYIAEGRKDAFLNPATVVWDYLIYSCPYCKEQYRYGYRDVERRVREYLSSIGAQYKEAVDELVETVDVRVYKTETVERVRDKYTKR